MSDTDNQKDKQAMMYFIAILLPKHLDERALVYKKQMLEMFGCKVGMKSPAHITIIPPYWMNEEKETLMQNDIKSIAQTVCSFDLVTADFSAFKPQTIFVAVEENGELNTVKKSADDFFRRSDYEMRLESRPFHPHITIATRDLRKKDFAEAWDHFQKKEFREMFKAEGLSLLKHNGRNWDLIFTATFRYLPLTEPVAQP